MERTKQALDLSFAHWVTWCSENHLPGYVAKQIYHWIYQKGVIDPGAFSNLSQSIRQKLSKQFDWSLPAVDAHLISSDSSEKFLLKASDRNVFEMVLMPYENRVTLCISSQVGCKLGCTFCQTGKLGFTRNLTAGEILSQIQIANRRLHEIGQGQKVTNIVFMGMGEPLDNYDAVLQACQVMIDPMALSLPKHRVTISTAGIVPQIEQLGRDLPVRLAISLHQSDNDKRSKIMPINRKYDLKTLKAALMNYPSPKRYGITFEYVMIEGVNDTLADAKKLVSFLHGIKCKVNLIPINHFPGIDMAASSRARIETFQAYLTSRSIPAPVRYSRGQDISGGCGQLAAKREDELHCDPRELARKRRQEKSQQTLSA